ncbi:hypothetical protein JCM16303_004280 [Sporobolomyces ruberrimus]
MSTPTRPTDRLRTTSSRPTVSSPNTLDASFSSSKPSREASQSKPTSFNLLPPPSQRATVEKKKRKPSSNSTSTSISLSPAATQPTKRVRPTPRPPGVPRPPTARRSRKSGTETALEDSRSTSHRQPSIQSTAPRPTTSSDTWQSQRPEGIRLSLPSRETSPFRPLSRSRPRSSHPPTPTPSPRKTSRRVLTALSTTPWDVIDPSNQYLLSSSRLFQLSHLELGEITRQQNQGKEPKYGEVKGSRDVTKKKRAREILDRLERERRERVGEGIKGKERAREGQEVPTWAKTRDGIEWETSLLKNLATRLSSTSGGQEFVPLVWASDLEQQKVRKASLGNLECWILGQEFPCKRVVVVGWVLEREWRETNGRKWWIYTIDDGTALVQVICPIEEGTATRNPHSRTSIEPILDPRLRIPNSLLSTASQPSTSQSPPRSSKYSVLEPTTPTHRTTFPVQTLVRVVGSITSPDFYQSELRITADRIESASPREEIEHHLVVGKLWDEVYSKEVDVKEILDRIEREEKDKAEADTSLASSSPGSEYGGGELSSCSGTTPRYRPTRPSKLSSDDITLTNFVIYIRHHVVRTYVQTGASSSLSLPPPSSQGSLPPTPSPGDEEPNREEWCLPFEIAELRKNKHLELFAKRLGIEKDRKERENRERQRTKLEREGDLSLLESTNSQEGGEKGSVWIAKEARGGGTVKVGKNRVEMGSSKLVEMLPPPSTASRRTRSQGVAAQDNDQGEQELEGRRLEKEIKRCWEDAIRMMRKNGMIVEYVPNDEEDEVEVEWSRSRHEATLPDEPTRSDNTPRRSRTSDSREDDTPRASSKTSTSFPSLAPTQPQRFQLVTPVSLAPLILEHLRIISHSFYSSSGSSSSSSSARRSITELDVRLALYRDDRWSAVAKYGEVVRRSLQVLENWGEIVPKGEGYRLA